MEKEEWKITELVNDKKPDRKYYVSNIGRMKWVEGEKEYIQFDPKKSSNKAVNTGFKTHINGKGLNIKKLVYCTFKNLPFENRYQIINKDGNKSNISIENLKDILHHDSKEELDIDIKKAKPFLSIGKERWVHMDIKNKKVPSTTYYISDLGRVYMFNTDTQIGKMRIDYVNGIGKARDGYLRIGISGRNYMVHRLVISYFTHEPYSSPTHVHHINGISHDNRLSNLISVSTQEHSDIEYKKRYSKNKDNRKYDWETICTMRDLHENKGLAIFEVAKRYNEKHGTISQILNYTTYQKA